MTDPVKSRIQELEALLKNLTDASYSVLCESNGVEDNEWTVKDGVATPQFPVAGFWTAIKKLDEAYTAAHDYFNIEEAEKRRKWADACATASFVMDTFKKAQAEKTEAQNLILSSLHRNIADAIYGTLKQTMEERKEGVVPSTIHDELDKLVSEGKLTEFTPKK
jgi:hypothetical protein